MNLGILIAAGLLVLAFAIDWVLRYAQRKEDAKHPVITNAAMLADKQATKSGGFIRVGRIDYLGIFELADGERVKLRMSREEYIRYMEGERGVLTYQGSRFINFDRQMPEGD